MYKNESHAKEIDPSKFKKVTAEEIEEGRRKAVQKKKMDRSNWKKVTAEEVEAGRQNNPKYRAIKEAKEKAAKKKISGEIKNDTTLMKDANKRDDEDLVIEDTKNKTKIEDTKNKTKSTSYADALKKDSKLNSYIKQRKGLTKGTPEYNAVQNKINAAYGKGPQRSTKTVDSSKKKSTIKSSVVDYDPAAEKKKAADARNAKEKAANESKASKLAETKKAATTKIDKKKLKSQAGEGYKDALADAKKKKSSAKESLKQKASGKKAIEYKEKTKKEKIQDTKEDFSFDRKKLKREKGTDAVKEARAKKKEEVGRAKGKKKIVKADNRASYAEAAKDMITSNPIGSESPMFFAGMKMNKSKPMMKGKLCMKSFRSGRRG